MHIVPGWVFLLFSLHSPVSLHKTADGVTQSFSHLSICSRCTGLSTKNTSLIGRPLQQDINQHALPTPHLHSGTLCSSFFLILPSRQYCQCYLISQMAGLFAFIFITSGVCVCVCSLETLVMLIQREEIRYSNSKHISCSARESPTFTVIFLIISVSFYKGLEFWWCYHKVLCTCANEYGKVRLFSDVLKWIEWLVWKAEHVLSKLNCELYIKWENTNGPILK